MFKRPLRWMIAAALVVGTLSACDEGPGPTGVDPFSTSEDRSADVTGTSHDADFERQAASYKRRTGATLVSTETAVDGTVVTAIVGRDGGTLRAGDHTLVIPPRAVIDDTWFRMEVVAGANILVDLSAFEFDDGRIVHSDPVSAFSRVPLTLVLSYEDVISGHDGTDLRNVYLYLDSPSHLVPLVSTVNHEAKTISSPIDHFSKYGMAIE